MVISGEREGGRGRGNIRVGEWEAQTIECKAQGCIVQQGGYSQYVVITVNGNYL